MDEKDRVQKREKGEVKMSERGIDLLSLRNPCCLLEEGWMRGEGEEGWPDEGRGGGRVIAADDSLPKGMKNNLNR